VHQVGHLPREFTTFQMTRGAVYRR